MAHALDKTKGKAAIAYRGETPWHGLGQTILPQDSIDDIRIKAGIDYDVVKTPVCYSVPMDSSLGPRAGAGTGLATSKDSCVLYRSDTGRDLSVVSSKYHVVQPKEVIEFYRDLTEKFGFELETVGALKEGRKVWALANTGKSLYLREQDRVLGYLLLATSYDGSMATTARFTSVRVVCNNTLTIATARGTADVTVPHSTKFDAERTKEMLCIGENWERFAAQAEAMANRPITQDETVQLLMQAYFGLATPDAIAEFHKDEKQANTAKKTMERLQEALFNSPGAHLASARGTLWGVLNAVTRDVDFNLPSRSPDTRLDKAWFGVGNGIKQKAMAAALEMVK